MNKKVIKVAKNIIELVSEFGTGVVIGGVGALATAATSKNQNRLILKSVAGTIAGAVVATYMKNKVIDPTVDAMFESFETAAEHENSSKTVINCVVL